MWTLTKLIGKVRRYEVVWSSQALLDLCTCPLTHMVFRRPALAPDGVTYSWADLFQWLQQQATSPFTRKAMQPGSLRPNRLARKLLDIVQGEWPDHPGLLEVGHTWEPSRAPKLWR